MKKFARNEVPEDIFALEKLKLFSKFLYKIFVLALHDIIGLKKLSLSFYKS